MKPFIITTDSASDLPKNYLKNYNLYIEPLYYTLQDVCYGGNKNLDYTTFYQRMRDGEMPITNAIIPEHMSTGLRPYLEQGYDILHIAFSSALSASCQNAIIAANELMEEFPNSKIVVVDSLSASLGQGLIVHKALQLQKTGKTMEEIVEWIEHNKDNVCHYFTVDDLNHLYRGGRISKTRAVIGSIINVKPILHVNKEGKLIAHSTVRGRKKALTTLVDKMEKALSGFEKENDVVFISHGDCLEDAEFVASLIKERFNIKEVIIGYISPTIGAHAGPGTVALFFLGNDK